MLKLALQSLWARRLTAGLTLLAVAISVTLLLGVERVRTQARESFSNTVSGTNLIVAPLRSGESAALLGVSHRQPHQQRGVGTPIRPSSRNPASPGPSRSPLATPTRDFGCSAPMATTSLT